MGTESTLHVSIQSCWKMKLKIDLESESGDKSFLFHVTIDFLKEEVKMQN